MMGGAATSPKNLSVLPPVHPHHNPSISGRERERGEKGGERGEKGHMGVVGRSVEYIFAQLDRFPQSRVKVSCLEIYQEGVFDLFGEGDTKEHGAPPLPVREDMAEGFYPEGAKLVEFASAESIVVSFAMVSFAMVTSLGRH
jgi:hypothetical protein